jgi:tRNA(adenine34) deaminase
MAKDFMEIAIEEAQKAFSKGEVPVGAVLVDNYTDEIIARSHNLVETEKNPTFHAEILAIHAGTHALKEKWLTNCNLYVTLEPCAMCAQAISLARINRLYFGAYDP